MDIGSVAIWISSFSCSPVHAGTNENGAINGRVYVLIATSFQDSLIIAATPYNCTLYK